MKSEYTSDREASFSHGIQPIQVLRRRREQLAIEQARAKQPATKHHGADPYNTSGGFDRSKNWERVGKR